MRAGQCALRSFRPGVLWGFVSLPATLHHLHYNFGRPHQTLTKAAGGSGSEPGRDATWPHRRYSAIDWDRAQVEANIGIALSGVNAAS